MAAVRILLCGDVLGQFNQLFKRVSSVEKTSGPFVALFCVGQFFPDDPNRIDEIKQFLDGSYQIPLPTYFIGDYGHVAGVVLSPARIRAKEHGLVSDGIPICKNLYWLKGSGMLGLQGLRVAYLAGKDVSSFYHDAKGAESSGAFHEDDVDTLRAFADESHLTDLFLSNEWPQGVLNGVTGPPELDPSTLGSSIIAEVVKELKPRYHIAGSEGFFYARDPYRDDSASHVTRFVGLATVGNEKKQKFLHALSLTPAASMAVKELSLQPPNTTKSPYTASSGKGSSKVSLSSKSSASVPHSEGQYWRFSTANSRAKDRGGVSGEKVCFEFMMKGSCSRGDSCNFKHERSTEKVIAKGACFDFLTKGKCSRGSDCKFRHTMDEDKTSSTETGIRSSAPCWFCLSSPNVDVDLVIEVGDHCYCAMAKGGLVDGHVLLIPIDHFSSMLSLSQPALRELNNYKDKLRKFYNNQQKTIAVFERCVQFRGGSHAHLQVVPIPFSKASQVRSYFVSAAKELGFTLQKIPSSEENFCTENALKHHIEGEKNYFFVELPEGMVLVHVLESGEDIPVQFGREVLAKLLGVPERGDWRACKLSKDDERTLSDKFRREFSVFQER